MCDLLLILMSWLRLCYIFRRVIGVIHHNCPHLQLDKIITQKYFLIPWQLCDSSPTAIQSKAFLARLLKDDWIVHRVIKAHMVEADCFREALQASNGILTAYNSCYQFFPLFISFYAFTQAPCHTPRPEGVQWLWISLELSVLC